MVQAGNLLFVLLRRHDDDNIFGACSDDIENSCSPKLKSMDEEPSRTITHKEEKEEEEEQDVPSSSSRDWLQLALATPRSAPVDRRQVSTEVELFRDRPSSSSSSSVVPMLRLLPRPMPWGSWNPSEMMMIRGDMSAPTSTMPEFVTTTPFGLPPGSSGAPAAAEARTGIRVISPPRRQAGVWLILQAAQDQGRQPLLPQIAKNYLRIKDGRLTVRLLMKYLVNKLGLEDESEVEITCRDQLLLPFLTLQYVRDNIWCLGDDSDSPSIYHVMTLQYRRSMHQFLRCSHVIEHSTNFSL